MSQERTEPNPHRAAGLARLRRRAARWAVAGAAALLLAVALAFGLLNSPAVFAQEQSSDPGPRRRPRCR